MASFIIPVPNLVVNQGTYSPLPIPNTATAPTNPAVHANQLCASRQPTIAEAVSLNESGFLGADLVLEFLPGNQFPGQKYAATFDYISGFGQSPTQVTIYEVPAGSGEYYLALKSRIVGRGYPNEHKLIFTQKVFTNITTCKN